LRSVSYYPYCKPEKLFKTGWKAFVSEDVDGQHIRLYKLKKGTRIANDLQNSSCVVAVVVNCEDSYELDPEQLHDITIPLIVVPASEGKEIYNILMNYNVGDILARIEIESGVDISTVQQPQFRTEKQPSDYQSQMEVQTEQPCSIPAPLSGSGSSIRYGKDSLQDTLQHFLFKDGNPTDISSCQPEYFLMVTTAFENYPMKVYVYSLRKEIFFQSQLVNWHSNITCMVTGHLRKGDVLVRVNSSSELAE